MAQYEKRIKELQDEANSLLERRKQAQVVIGNIDVRVSQIQGALSELDRLKKEEKESKDGKPKEGKK